MFFGGCDRDRTCDHFPVNERAFIQTNDLSTNQTARNIAVSALLGANYVSMHSGLFGSGGKGKNEFMLSLLVL